MCGSDLWTLRYELLGRRSGAIGYLHLGGPFCAACPISGTMIRDIAGILRGKRPLALRPLPVHGVFPSFTRTRILPPRPPRLPRASQRPAPVAARHSPAIASPMDHEALPALPAPLAMPAVQRSSAAGIWTPASDYCRLSSPLLSGTAVPRARSVYSGPSPFPATPPSPSRPARHASTFLAASRRRYKVG